MTKEKERKVEEELISLLRKKGTNLLKSIRRNQELAKDEGNPPHMQKIMDKNTGGVYR